MLSGVSLSVGHIHFSEHICITYRKNFRNLPSKICINQNWKNSITTTFLKFITSSTLTPLPQTSNGRFLRVHSNYDWPLTLFEKLLKSLIFLENCNKDKLSFVFFGHFLTKIHLQWGYNVIIVRKVSIV